VVVERQGRLSSSICGVSWGRNSSAGVKPTSISMMRWTVMSPSLNVVVAILPAPLVLSGDPMLAGYWRPDKRGREATGMNDVSTVALSPETVMRQMKQNGVTDIVWLPDSETNWLFLLMQADPDLRLVGVTREGHACSITAGLFAGGRKPMMLIQNTGMLESGDSIRGWLMGLNVPVVLMVGYRGYTRHGVNTDTAATYTERFLMAFNIPFFLIENDADSERISKAFELAEKTRQPVVVLVGDEYHGFNR
jgi:sulfopyruvate decarboxylase subunit alpha